MSDQQQEWSAFLRAREGLTRAQELRLARSLRDAGNRESALRWLAPTATQRRESQLRQTAIDATSEREISIHCQL